MTTTVVAGVRPAYAPDAYCDRGRNLADLTDRAAARTNLGLDVFDDNGNLTLSGTITGSKIAGNGSGLTNLPPPTGFLPLGGGTLTGTLVGLNANFLGLFGSCITTSINNKSITTAASAAAVNNLNNLKLSLAGGNLTGSLTGPRATFTGLVQAGSFKGDGSMLTNLPCLALTGGALSGGLTGTTATFNATVYGNKFSGDGSLLTNLPSPTGFLRLLGGSLTGDLFGTNATFTGQVQAVSFKGDGSLLTNLPITVPAFTGGNLTSVLSGTSAVFSADVNAGQFIGDGSQLTNLPNPTGFLSLVGGSLTGDLFGTKATFTGQVQAGSFKGDGSLLTNLPIAGGALSLSGGTLTGALVGQGASFSTLGGACITSSITSTATNIAASANGLKIVNDVAKAALPKAGGTLTGTLTGTTATFNSFGGTCISSSVSSTSTTTAASSAAVNTLNTAKLNTSGGTLTGVLLNATTPSFLFQSSTFTVASSTYTTLPTLNWTALIVSRGANASGSTINITNAGRYLFAFSVITNTGSTFSDRFALFLNGATLPLVVVYPYPGGEVGKTTIVDLPANAILSFGAIFTGFTTSLTLSGFLIG